MQSIIVVLPAPLGPMMQRSSPTSMVRLSAFSALKPSKLTVMSSTYSATPCAEVGLAQRLQAAERGLAPPALACRAS